jgi:hypothetical protein
MHLFIYIYIYICYSDELRALGPHPGSAELHPKAAAEASYKLFTEVMQLKVIRMYSD